MRKFGLVVKGPTRERGSGESVKSILGEGDCKLTYSAFKSVKIRASSVFIAGPAGYHGSEQAPEEPRTIHDCRFAWASSTLGRWKLPDDGPTRIARENAMEKTIMSLRSFLLAKNLPELRRKTR